MADQISTKRPNGTVQQGAWSIAGGAPNAHTALQDDGDATYVQVSTRCMLQSQKLRLAIADWTTADIPTGSKIKSLRATARCGTVSSGSRPRFVLWFAQSVIFALLTGSITRILHSIFAWNCPRPPPSAPSTQWFLQELEYKTRDAKNEEWTLTSVNAFTVDLGRDDVTGVNGKISEVYVDAAFNERPVGTATGPSTTQTTTTRPSVTWNYSDPESDPQEAFRVRVFNDDQYTAGGFDPLTSTAYSDSGWTLGEDVSYSLPIDLVNDTYRAYVQVRQKWDGIGTHESVPTFIGWTQNVPGPPAPVLTATTEDNLWRVRLNLSKGGSSPVTETYNIWYSDNAGVSWVDAAGMPQFVRGGHQVTAVGGDTAVLWDYEAPLNASRWYIAQAFRTLGSIKIGGNWSAIVTATPRSREFLLKDPLVPALNMALPLAPKGDIPIQTRSQGIFKPLTKSSQPARAVAVIGPRYGVEGEMRLVFVEDDQANWEQFNALYQGGRTLLYQLPTGAQHYIHFEGTVALSDWDIDFGQVSTATPYVAYRTATVSYQEVARPE